MDFSIALEHLKAGRKVARAGWNGKGMYIYLVNGTEVPRGNLRNEADSHISKDIDTVNINGHIDMKAADGSITVGWTPSQPDLLAMDWEIVSNKRD